MAGAFRGLLLYESWKEGDGLLVDCMDGSQVREEVLDREEYSTLVMVDEVPTSRSSIDNGKDGPLSSLVSTVSSVSQERRLFDRALEDGDLGSLFLLPFRRFRKLEDVDRSIFSPLLYNAELSSGSGACLSLAYP